MQRILRLVEDCGPTHREGNHISATLLRSDLYLEVAPAVPNYPDAVMIQLLKDPGSTKWVIPQHMVVVAEPGLYRARHRIDRHTGRHGDKISIKEGELVEVVSTNIEPFRDHFHSFGRPRPWSIKQLHNNSNSNNSHSDLIINLNPALLEPIDHPVANTITGLLSTRDLSGGLLRPPAPPALHQTLAAIAGPVARLVNGVTELPPGYEGLELVDASGGRQEQGGSEDASGRTQEQRGSEAADEPPPVYSEDDPPEYSRFDEDMEGRTREERDRAERIRRDWFRAERIMIREDAVRRQLLW